MDSLIFHVIAWPTLLIALLLFGFAPGAVLRMIVLAFRRDDPRRTELLAELPHVPRIERPFWVVEQVEVALFEGLVGRLAELAGLKRRRRRSPPGPALPETARDRPQLKPLDVRLSPEVLEWVTELRALWQVSGLSINQFAARHPIDRGTVSRYLSGVRVPPDGWFLNMLLAILTERGSPATPTVRERLRSLQLQALRSHNPPAYRVRVLSDELEVAVTRKVEAERRTRDLEEQLAERNRYIQELTERP